MAIFIVFGLTASILAIINRYEKVQEQKSIKNN